GRLRPGCDPRDRARARGQADRAPSGNRRTGSAREQCDAEPPWRRTGSKRPKGADMTPIRIAALVAIGAAVVALAGVGRPDLAGGASEPSGGITVTGTGTVETVPDQAEFTLGVQSQGPTARGALAANSERMRHVLAALFSAGVAKKDVQTQDVSLSQTYSSDGRPDGYSAHNSVSVTIRVLAKAGAILDAASNA